MIDAVLFDLDDTLYNRGQAFRRWAEVFLTERLGDPESAEYRSALEWLIKIDANGYCARPEFCHQVKERFPEITESVAEFVKTFQIGLVRQIVPEEGTDSLLRTVASRGIPFGIVTNGSTKQQARKIAHLGLDKRATCVVISEAFGLKKPHPDIFLDAAKRVGVEPTRILFVGDNPKLDIEGARQVGMKTAWIRRGHVWPAEYADFPPDFSVNHLGELALP